ncbi:hypothetical protein [Streptomyces sp. ID01-9D]|uniref:hypothetical protein n=1 Tax=Streptomyces sp. ID01-9D TaxID=3028659 RepID=UPI0029C4FC1E|nr:hypothetical protein [Streptomyces sp. ID01-9D]MDX5573826.1 hypothetical protein [Streptomyces sp. ID01-9D]
MSTLTRPKPDTTTAVPAPLRGSVRVLLRLHRRSLWSAGAFLAAVAAALVAAVLRADHLVEDFAKSGCTTTGSLRSCFQPARSYADSMLEVSRISDYASLVLVALPAVVGAFVAGPLIAREGENGTFRLSWTQSVSPVQWLTARLTTSAMLVVPGTLALTAVLAWARPQTGVEYPAEWYELDTFLASGTVPVAHVLLALALGALIGLRLRRTVPAMAVSLVISGLVTVALVRLRDSLWSVTRDIFVPSSGYIWPDRAAVVEWGYITSGGDRLPADICTNALDLGVCRSEHAVTHGYLEYHPASHYWPLQLVETGILLALAALAVFAAFRVLRRLHG